MMYVVTHHAAVLKCYWSFRSLSRENSENEYFHYEVTQARTNTLWVTPKTCSKCLRDRKMPTKIIFIFPPSAHLNVIIERRSQKYDLFNVGG